MKNRELDNVIDQLNTMFRILGSVRLTPRFDKDGNVLDWVFVDYNGDVVKSRITGDEIVLKTLIEVYQFFIHGSDIEELPKK